MTKSIIIISLFLFLNFTVNAQQATAYLMDEAMAEAVSMDKHILVKFEASWCGWCHRMTKQLKDASVATYFNDNYVILPIVVFENDDKVSLENPGARKLIASYKGNEAGLPFWVILDASGNKITDSFNEKGRNLGCPASKEEVASFISKLRATSNISEEMALKVAQVFTKP